MGLVTLIAASDFTMITWIIMGVFALADLYMGYLALRLQANINKDEQRVLHHEFDICWFISAKLPQLGFIGTVIGLAHLLQTSTMGITAADSALVTNLMHSIGSTSGTALYPTLIGLIASLLIQLHLFILTFIYRAKGYVE
jgi:hypothetical protein